MKITGIFDSTPGRRYSGNAIGVLQEWFKTQKANVELRVGSGLTDKIRRDTFQNPEKYIDRWAKISSQYT